MGKVKAASNILKSTLASLKSDFILVQEPYTHDNKIQGIPQNWNVFSSTNKKAAIFSPSGNNTPIIISAKENAVAIKIHTDTHPITLVSAYSSPRENISRTLEDIRSIIQPLSKEEVIICADLNAHHSFWGYSDEDTRGKAVLDFIMGYNLFICNTSDAPPTHHNYNGSQGWPDLTICSHSLINSITNWEVLDKITNSDHAYIEITLSNTITSHKMRRYKTLHGNHTKFLNELRPHVPSLINNIRASRTESDVHSIAKSIQQEIITACNKSFKIKSIQIYQNPSWWNQKLEVNKKKVLALRRRAQRSDPTTRTRRNKIWKIEQAKFIKEIRIAKAIGWKKTCASATNPYGKHYKSAFQKTVLPTQLSVLQDASPQGSMKEIAQDILNKIFPFPTTTINPLSHSSSTRNDIPFSKQEITHVIKSLPNGKAPGIDGIDNLILKSLNKEFPDLLHSLFNKCLETSTFPDSFKISNIILFQKLGKDPKLPTSYRPIALLPTLGKALEKLLTQRLTFYLEKNNKLNSNQHGFREGKSVDSAISSLMDKIATARREGLHVIALSLDIKGAFDNILHQAILNNLIKNEAPPNIINIFANLLKNRKIILNTQDGIAIRDQLKGCPQGSCSGPALWNLVINDLLRTSWPENTHIQAFADDIILLIKAKTKEDLKNATAAAIS
ncbi:Retrovirus-related Pol polyprotein from type-1 retrotransposable element R1 [Araneus ventricosus]|uniref:Retrovirus-related Pol polyprotein from type-1 retrotransposable element R1 n=1 Tax=Araneus ventricosus TaxID=182803 RepID=A0A4Y2I6H9_ARAVE|nr:Retrovirus-related Pol polyprotein from type-1 retrotransposable element R1 [Araneus ventricosus]